MDRLHMPSAMPAELAERMSDRAGEFTEAELDAAHNELAEEIAEGPELWKALQSWLNVDGKLYDERLGLITKHVQALLSGLPVDHATAMTYQQRREISYSLAKCDAREWLREVIDGYLTDDMVRDRAEEIEAGRGE